MPKNNMTSKQMSNKADSLEKKAKKLREQAKRKENIEAVLKVFGAFKISTSDLNKAVDILNAEVKANDEKPSNPMKKKKTSK